MHPSENRIDLYYRLNGSIHFFGKGKPPIGADTEIMDERMKYRMNEVFRPIKKIHLFLVPQMACYWIYIFIYS